jgi:acyl carrier protein
MSPYTGVLAAPDSGTGTGCLDERFEDLLRRFLPFLPATHPLTENIDLREHGLDSMGVVELLAALENGYDVRFRDDALCMQTFATPRVLWNTLMAIR